MRIVHLAASIALFASASLFAADPKVGDTREDVVRLMGQPGNILPLAAGGHIYSYPRGDVFFDKKGVTKLDLISEEQLKKKDEQRREAPAREVATPKSKSQMLADFCKAYEYLPLRRPEVNGGAMVMLGKATLKNSSDGVVVSMRIIDTSSGGGGANYYAWIRLIDQDQQTVAQVRSIYLPVGGGLSEVPLSKFLTRDWKPIGRDLSQQIAVLEDSVQLRVEANDSNIRLIETSTSVRTPVAEGR